MIEQIIDYNAVMHTFVYYLNRFDAFKAIIMNSHHSYASFSITLYFLYIPIYNGIIYSLKCQTFSSLRSNVISTKYF